MAEPSDEFVLLMTTAGSDEQATTLARALVDRRLAACVNVISGVCSVYRWKDEVQREDERLLVVKTAARLVPRVQKAIRELHTYETPEVLVLPIESGDSEYLDWLRSCLVE